MGLRDIGETLPPGFRFYPSDEELVCHYLYKKVCNEQILRGTLVEIDLHVCEPWQLPDVAKLNSNEWYFFSFRDRKYATGFRANRATISGYWKATGKDRAVVDPKTRAVVGMRKTLVFYMNRAPNGIKTGWIMHEFRLENPHVPPKEDWVLCRVFHKSRSGENSSNLVDSPTYNNNNNIEQQIIMPNYGHQNDTVSFYHTTPYHHLHQHGQNPSTSIDPAVYVHVDNGDKMVDDDEAANNNTYKCDVDNDYGFLFDFDDPDNNGDMGFN
ncbi:hypothetical protein ABFS82_04G042200 [Erythranthe guttata]|uniref:NAC domain-containing protein n=1 Tax=Erythranthe guttata TaxID=4155 RepID=A0A022S292_ERYGU|nr:PREDICTED: protein CUP-SHAPED COTYLEDON 3-like [Erythranthe guttata]EYU46444.1 hypothetical protein MIMGU_mgv1a020209mg [Erythranthe guttata]|eukprot:XP_012837084.1 PREDICTED: protein CUP-SHAPED COTYLEDON 3-like [Erythranthe guttata]